MKTRRLASRSCARHCRRRPVRSSLTRVRTARSSSARSSRTASIRLDTMPRRTNTATSTRGRHRSDQGRALRAAGCGLCCRSSDHDGGDDRRAPQGRHRPGAFANGRRRHGLLSPSLVSRIEKPRFAPGFFFLRRYCHPLPLVNSPLNEFSIRDAKNEHQGHAPLCR